MNEFDDEKPIERFFIENAVKIEDNGFTRHVMRRLSDRAVRLSRLWTAFCATVAIILLFATKANVWIAGMARGIMADISTQYALTHTPAAGMVAAMMGAFVLSAVILAKELR